MSAIEVVDDPDGHLALASPTGPDSHIAAVVDAWARTIASPSTRRAYHAAVTGLLAEYGQITAATLGAWRDELAARGLARTTIRQRVAAARAFADWAARVGQLDPRIAAQLREVEPPKVRGEHAPRALPDEAVRLMDTYAPAIWPDDPLRAAQARAALALLSGCGLRVGELALARHRDLSPARPNAADAAALAGRTGARTMALDVHGKGGRRRTVPVPPHTLRAIHALNRAAERTAHRDDPLVPALTGHRPARLAAAAPGHPPPAITARRAHKLILRLAEGVNQHAARPADLGDERELVALADAHPHALRHGYALRYLRRHPEKLGRLRELLGHADISTTARYLAATIADDQPSSAHDPE